MKVDSLKQKERYLAWKEKTKEGIPGLSKENSYLFKQFLNDMENGVNISLGSKKGARSYIRLNSLRDRLVFFDKQFKHHFNLNSVVEIKEEQLCKFFTKMRNGEIRKRDNKEYKSVADYVKTFKCLWHWYVKVKKKAGTETADITVDLDTKREKPKWVYLTEEQIRKLCDNAKYEYRVLIWFLYDTGIRLTELINLKVSDLSENFTKLNIRNEISKTFGRRINLVLCPDLLREYIKNQNIKPEDYLFPIDAKGINKYLKRLAERVLGSEVSIAGEKYSNLTLYDFRHNSACYFLPRYKSEASLKFRFGWKKSEMIHYYTELFGMCDDIKQEDILIDVTKTEIEKRLTKAEQDRDLLQERVNTMEQNMKNVLEFINKVSEKVSKL